MNLLRLTTMNNIRLRVPTLAPFLHTEAVAFLNSEITMSVLTGEFIVDLTGCHYNNDMFSDSDTGNYYFPKTVQSPVMSLEQWWLLYPHATPQHVLWWLCYLRDNTGYFKDSFPHNFHMGDVVYEPRKLIDTYTSIFSGAYVGYVDLQENITVEFSEPLDWVITLATMDNGLINFTI